MANKKFDDLPSSSTPDGSEILATDQDKGGGTLETRKITLSNILEWLRTKNDPRYAAIAGDKTQSFAAKKPSDDYDVTPKGYTDGRYAPKAGDKTQSFAVSDPSDDDDTMPRGYADSRFARLTGGSDANFTNMLQVDGDAIVSRGHVSGKGYWREDASGVVECWAMMTIENTQHSESFMEGTFIYPKALDEGKDIVPSVIIKDEDPQFDNVYIGSHTESVRSLTGSKVEVWLRRTNKDNDFSNSDSVTAYIKVIGIAA